MNEQLQKAAEDAYPAPRPYDPGYTLAKSLQNAYIKGRLDERKPVDVEDLKETLKKHFKDQGWIVGTGALDGIMDFFAPHLKVDEWISVKERLPKINELVLISNRSNVDWRANYWNGEQWVLTGLMKSPFKVTHWMPIPNPPAKP